ncbi:6-hydroxyaminopurine reductase [Neisseria sp. Ec49-e6-T10]|uniref:6-hydroxyaminopurine reductase n=1 Tax=Neisseria sp. Ec49-e6-T10 TaxID=3140744 RepID=UPI003EB7BD90
MYFPRVYVGKVCSYQDIDESAIKKREVNTRIFLNELGLTGDEQAEQRFHGGPDRALCHYPEEHYIYWQKCFPQIKEHFCASAFGENIATVGLTEQNVCIGDVFRWADAMIQVTQPRSPCYKLNDHFCVDDLSVRMQQTGLCGWLYRVICVGEVSSNEPLELVNRYSDVSVEEAITIAFHLDFDPAQYQRLSSATGLSSSWQNNMRKRITEGKIEDFNRRLLGNHDR